ncbi:MAG: hypothetical protein IIY46_08995, partial [Lachnospiraceae bacterium]|nr:hypothetical protein [Lachnospiraceae bacterium]
SQFQYLTAHDSIHPFLQFFRFLQDVFRDLPNQIYKVIIDIAPVFFKALRSEQNRYRFEQKRHSGAGFVYNTKKD